MNTLNLRPDLVQEITGSLISSNNEARRSERIVEGVDLQTIKEPIKKVEVYQRQTVSLLSMLKECTKIWIWENGSIRSMLYTLPVVERKRLSALDRKKVKGHEWLEEIEKGFYLIDSVAIKERKINLSQIIRLYKDETADYYFIPPDLFRELQRSKHFEKITKLSDFEDAFGRKKLEIERLWKNAKELNEKARSKAQRLDLGKHLKKYTDTNVNDSPFTTCDLEFLSAIGRKSKKTQALIKREKKIQKSGKDIDSPVIETFVASGLDISNPSSRILDVGTIFKVFGRKGNKDVTDSLRRICNEFNISIV